MIDSPSTPVPNVCLRPSSRGGHLSVKKRLVDRYGTRRLSRRQWRVVELVAQGLKNREIAEELGIGEYVVRNYVSKIYQKIGVSSRVELALWSGTPANLF